MIMAGDNQSTTPGHGATQGINNEFTVFADVLPGHEKALRETITKWGHDPNLSLIHI